MHIHVKVTGKKIGIVALKCIKLYFKFYNLSCSTFTAHNTDTALFCGILFVPD